MAGAIVPTLPVGTRQTNIFDLLDLPQVISYMAAARFTHENDDVWANMSVYHDNDGDGLWRIIPFDMNLSWGAAYLDSSNDSGIQVTNDNHKSFPLYGSSQALSLTSGNYNRLYDVIFSVPQTREMVLRRIRTLLDTWVKPPGTPAASLPIEPMIRLWRDEIAPDAALDRDSWGWPAYGGQCNFYPGISLSNGVEILISEFIDKRRQHLYGKHSITNTALTVGFNKTNNAGIPLAQPTNTTISIVSWDYNPASGNQHEEFVCLTNANDYAVDMSGWRITGGISLSFQPGTVIPARSALYLSPDAAAFRSRATAPRGGMGLFVQGGYSGQLSARGDTMTLQNPAGVTVSSASYTGSPSPAQQFLRITEIMYNPAPAPAITSDEQQLEYLELQNISTNLSLNLTGVQFTKGIAFTFTNCAITILAPGPTSPPRPQPGRLPHPLRQRTPGCRRIHRRFGQRRRNTPPRRRRRRKGARIRLRRLLVPPSPTGLGFSLVIVDPLAAWDTWGEKASWRASGSLGGSPGTLDPDPPAFPPVLVNEALSHTDPPRGRHHRALQSLLHQRQHRWMVPHR